MKQAFVNVNQRKQTTRIIFLTRTQLLNISQFLFFLFVVRVLRPVLLEFRMALRVYGNIKTRISMRYRCSSGVVQFQSQMRGLYDCPYPFRFITLRNTISFCL